MTIQSRVINRGDACESEWPPMEPERGGGGSFYWDKERQEFVEGYPPPVVEKIGQAPFVITDTIDAYYHPGAERFTDSRSKLRQLDKDSGCFTTDKMQISDGGLKKQATAARRKDLKESLHRAVAQIDAGTAPLSEETREMCKQNNELLSKKLNFDAFNVAGKKNDRRGKKYRRK